MSDKPVATLAAAVPPRARPSTYPPDLVARIGTREKRQLGDLFGLRRFGVNLTRLGPGGASSLRHAHALQDEFIYVLEGTPTLVTNAGRTALRPGMCAGFAAGSGDAHHLLNESDADTVYLEIGDRTPGDSVDYPDDDLMVRPDAAGRSRYLRKNGEPI